MWCLASKSERQGDMKAGSKRTTATPDPRDPKFIGTDAGSHAAARRRPRVTWHRRAYPAVALRIGWDSEATRKRADPRLTLGAAGAVRAVPAGDAPPVSPDPRPPPRPASGFMRCRGRCG